MAITLSISEILENAAAHIKQKDVIESLQQNANQTLIDIFRGMFDDRVVWDLPEGIPPYKPANISGMGQNILYREARKFYLFTKDGNPNLKPARKEQLFIQLLETVPNDDAKILIAMKDKKSPYKMITKITVEKAFPGIFD